VSVSYSVRAWLRKTDLVVLMAALVVVLGLWIFVALAVLVMHGSTLDLDTRILNNFPGRDDVPWWVDEMWRDMTALGGVVFLTFLTSAVVIYLLMSRMFGAALLVIVATVGAHMINNVLKEEFQRQRPALHARGSRVGRTLSFPSGHSTLSASVFLTLGALLARFVRQRARKVYFLGMALLLAVMVGLSRLYLQVHWPTDVLAGWTVGLTWATLCWLVAYFLQRRGAVERSLD
jgi:undecaprenyl-diphosphatase